MTPIPRRPRSLPPPARPGPTPQRRNPLAEGWTYSGAALSRRHTLRLPSPIPGWLDVRRWLWLGWVTIEADGWLAMAKVHYRADRWGIAGTRVHTLYIWRHTGQTEYRTQYADYSHQLGVECDRSAGAARPLINTILEYFK